MHSVMIGIGEPLYFVIEGQAQLVAHIMADAFREIVLHQGEKSAGHGNCQKGEGCPDQHLLSLLSGHAQHVLCLIDGLAKEPRNGELQHRSHDGRTNSQTSLIWMAE
jgi:hypothetical protein